MDIPQTSAPSLLQITAHIENVCVPPWSNHTKLLRVRGNPALRILVALRGEEAGILAHHWG